MTTKANATQPKATVVAKPKLFQLGASRVSVQLHPCGDVFISVDGVTVACFDSYTVTDPDEGSPCEQGNFQVHVFPLTPSGETEGPGITVIPMESLVVVRHVDEDVVVDLVDKEVLEDEIDQYATDGLDPSGLPLLLAGLRTESPLERLRHKLLGRVLARAQRQEEA